MSVGPLPPLASALATPLAQAKGSDTERVLHDVANQQRQATSNTQAANAAGIAAADGEDNQTSDRDADGRRLWELPPTAGAEPDAPETSAAPPISRDASGQCGNQLDLTG